MIHLNFDFLDEALDLSGLTCLVIEERQVFAKVVQALYQYTGEGDYLKFFDDKYNKVKPDQLLIITDILGFDMNSAAVLKLIYHDLELQISEKPEIKSQIEALLQKVTRLVNDELLDFEIDLESDEITFPEVFKALGVQVEIKSDTIFERVFEILEVFKYLSKKQVLVFVNLGSYLTPEEMTQVEEYVSLENIALLLLENRKVSGLSSQYVLDEDFVLLRQKSDIIEQ